MVEMVNKFKFSDGSVAPNARYQNLLPTRAMLHDSEDYPEPQMFNSDRFIKDGKINPDVRDPLTVAFGFGRRICPGRYSSNGSLFILIASVLHVFNIHPERAELLIRQISSEANLP
ncbi:hypothetical protein QCA50_018522 [Cerrena zonata]|uniref:Cytochrome P450 n=1 Tax=Cerrena zonata TaxID=2478898 RepID=A0AAW0FMI3_9APHY